METTICQQTAEHMPECYEAEYQQLGLRVYCDSVPSIPKLRQPTVMEKRTCPDNLSEGSLCPSEEREGIGTRHLLTYSITMIISENLYHILYSIHRIYNFKTTDYVVTLAPHKGWDISQLFESVLKVDVLETGKMGEWTL